MADNTVKLKKEVASKTCGIIMPISQHPDYPTNHWKEVLEILTETISQTEFKPNLVSDDVAIGLIHDRIVTNIYNNEIIICDVSSKNPNVMFELGLRLAFDKPTIIIKDEKTSYSFDTGVIEHLEYPSSLRFNQIVEFKKELIQKINATYQKSIDDPKFSPFLKSFGKTIVPASLTPQEIPETKFIVDELIALRKEMQILRYEQREMDFRRFSSNRKLSEYESLIDKTFNELMSKKSRISQSDVIDAVVEKLEMTSLNIQKEEIEKFVNEYLDKRFKKK